MSTGNGHDPATVRIVEILEKIHGEIEATNGRLDTWHNDVVELRADVHETRQDLAAFKEETRGALTDIRADIHAIRGELIDTRGDHAARLRRLEDVVFKPAAE